MLMRSKKASSSMIGNGEWSKSESTTVSNDNLSPSDIGWVGPINLRRRAKPELENERHRDISLRLSIQEVKNLPSKGKYFCEICLDRTLYARTTSKQSDGTVFWGEKFELNNLPDVSIITINLYKQGDPVKEKRSRSKGQNQFLAFVTIPLKEAFKTSEIQNWLPMRTQNLTNIDQWQGSTNRSTDLKGSNSSMTSPTGPRFRKRSTPITCFRHSTSASAFSIVNESLDETDRKTGLVGAFSRGKKKSSWSAGVPPTDVDLTRESGNIKSKRDSGEPPSSFASQLALGACMSLSENVPTPQIRMNLQYEAIDVLPLDYYGELLEFIKTQSISIIRSLEPQLTAKQKEELASCLVNIHEKLPDLSVPQLLTELLQEDLRQHNDESMIFRSNTTGSKAVECYIKLVGNEYLQQILKASIDHLLTSSEDFEIDPSRVTCTEVAGTANPSNTSNQVDRNRTALIRYLKQVWRKISSSVSILPPELREAFSSLSHSLERTHGSKTAARLISSCLFLRFICPAIHGPVLFGLTTAVPESGRVSRNLTLVAKVLQNLANLTTFGDKEHHMKTLNSFVEAEIPVMWNFLQSVSCPSDDHSLDLKSDCHKYIDLGYEFAKLSSLLLSYTRNISLPEELSDLSGILSFIDEHTNDAVLSSWTPEVIACRRYASCDSNGPLLRSQPRFSSTDSVTYGPETALKSDRDGFSNYSSTSSLVPKPEETGINPSAFLNGTNGTPRYKSGVTGSNTAPTSRHGSTSDSNAIDATFFIPEASPLEENTEELIVQYQEQLRQLNACIDRVETSEVCPRAVTSYPQIMRLNGHGNSAHGSTCPVREHTPTITPVTTPSRLPQPAKLYGRTNGDELVCASDYEIGDLTERSDDQCNSEPVGMKIDRREDDVIRQSYLVGSPSLDQLAERLHELKLLLKHERQELEEVMASKTQVIQKQEQSIEQLASELNQLRRIPMQPGRIRPTDGHRQTSEANSPTSSLSSDCFISHQSDGIFTMNDSAFVHTEFQPSPRHASDCVVNPQCNSNSSLLPPSLAQAQVNNRARSFRVKPRPDRTELTTSESVTRYGSNLLDLSRASEGTGIPLGELIVAKQSLPVRRRFSESRLLHH